MKKRRPPRPRKRKARPAPIVAEAKGKIASTNGAGPVASPLASNALIEPARGQLGKEGMQADATVSRPARVSAMTNARAWTIFAGFIVSWLLLASVVVIFAEYWT